MMTVAVSWPEGLPFNYDTVIYYLDMLAKLCTSDRTAYPTSILDFVLVAGAAVIVAYAFYLAIRHTLSPGEKSDDHIKRRILEDEDEGYR